MVRKAFIAFILGFIFLFNSNLSAHAENQSDIQVLIEFKQSVNPQVVYQANGEILHSFPFLHLIAANVPKENLDMITSNPNVSTVTEDQPVETTSQTKSWGYTTVKPKSSKGASLTGKGVNVAVIDTGISQHPDLAIKGGYNAIAGSNTANYQDDNGHGTIVAGIIAAQDNSIGTVGIAPDVNLYAVKALGQDGTGSESDVIAGIVWCMQNNIDVINMSLSSPDSTPFLHDIIQKATQQGITIVAAAGNDGNADGSDDTIEYPAKYSEVIAVGAVDQAKHRASFSGSGSELELASPGVSIVSTSNDGGYLSESGTSMATPYVTGIVALYKEEYPDMSQAELRDVVDRNALDLGKKGKDSLYGYGLAQAPLTHSGFTDVGSSYWDMSDIRYLSDQKIIYGFGDQTFRPLNFVTRAQTAAFIGRALSENGTQASTEFADVGSGNFASGYIKAGVAQGYINGYGDGTFRPAQNITRGETALFLYRAFHIPKVTTDAFKDVPDGEMAVAINSLSHDGITDGYGNGIFKPNDLVTRDQFVAFLSRILQKQ